MNCLVSELANVAAEERAMIDEFEALLATTAAMQVRKFIKTSIHFSSYKNSPSTCNPNSVIFPLLALFSMYWSLTSKDKSNGGT